MDNFPKRQPLVRLVEMILSHQAEECIVGKWYLRPVIPELRGSRAWKEPMRLVA
ncbi:MAG: hypothetical protein VKO21_09095 [Candidatus Sericytochromatia bacterium]|nr:hypothetical protein [Candidatus Sericytochromatia bacterium]